MGTKNGDRCSTSLIKTKSSKSFPECLQSNESLILASEDTENGPSSFNPPSAVNAGSNCAFSDYGLNLAYVLLPTPHQRCSGVLVDPSRAAELTDLIQHLDAEIPINPELLALVDQAFTHVSSGRAPTWNGWSFLAMQCCGSPPPIH